jgi:hypothetical protein
MNRRSIFVLLALSLAACAGEEPAPQQSSTLRLNGTYRPTQDGAIQSVTFANDKDYSLVPSGCTAADCVDVGTYRLDSEASRVILKNARGERTIRLEGVKTADAAVALVKSFLSTREDLSEPESIVQRGQQTTNGQGQATGDQQQLNGSNENQLVDQIGQLIKTIMEAVMDGQNMKKDDEKKDDEKKDEPPKPDCNAPPAADAPQAVKDAFAAACPK